MTLHVHTCMMTRSSCTFPHWPKGTLDPQNPHQTRACFGQLEMEIRFPYLIYIYISNIYNTIWIIRWFIYRYSSDHQMMDYPSLIAIYPGVTLKTEVWDHQVVQNDKIHCLVGPKWPEDRFLDDFGRLEIKNRRFWSFYPIRWGIYHI
jgi:hypothetical protein